MELLRNMANQGSGNPVTRIVEKADFPSKQQAVGGRCGPTECGRVPVRTSPSWLTVSHHVALFVSYIAGGEADAAFAYAAPLPTPPLPRASRLNFRLRSAVPISLVGERTPYLYLVRIRQAGAHAPATGLGMGEEAAFGPEAWFAWRVDGSM